MIQQSIAKWEYIFHKLILSSDGRLIIAPIESIGQARPRKPGRNCENTVLVKLAQLPSERMLPALKAATFT
jgi:hypothetical protein